MCSKVSLFLIVTGKKKKISSVQKQFFYINWQLGGFNCTIDTANSIKRIINLTFI